MTVDGSDRSFGVPHFDVVLRGYDRRQVDEHLSRLNRVLARMRSDLESARSRPAPLGPPPPPGLRPRPTPRPRPGETPGDDDVVGTFTDRMRTILQAAEEEAAEIRAKAEASARAVEARTVTERDSVREQEEAVRAELAHLVRQRDAVLADLTRVRGQLEALLSGPTARITVPAQDGPSTAAARRDPGAGQPLPGAAPPLPAPAHEPAGVERTAQMRPPASPPGGLPRVPGAERPRTALPTATLPDAAPPPATLPDASPPGSPGDATLPDASPPGSPGPDATLPDADPPDAAPRGDATVKVGAVGRPAGTGAPDASERDPDDDRPATGVEPASAARPG